MPDKIVVHWIIIKEPNDFTKFGGRIYVLGESVGESNSNFLSRFFGYSKEKIEPRLYGLKYSRGLHERLERQIIPSLKKGQPMAGRFERKAKARSNNKGSLTGKKGGGSESQEQEWHFHKLLPSEIHEKP